MAFENRASEIRLDNDTTRLPVTRLIDLDTAIINYLKSKVLVGLLNDKNDPLIVPVMYANPELWVSAQKNGFLRDKESNKLRVPLLAIKRGNVVKNRDRIRNLDANSSRIYKVYENLNTKANAHDPFYSVSTIIPKKEFNLIVIPDFVDIQYNCKIWTDKIPDINSIIEAINYADSSYWGELDRYKFLTSVSDFSEVEEVTTDDGRSVRCDFNLMVKGYIIPQTTQRELNAKKKGLSYNSMKLSFAEVGEVMTSVSKDINTGITNKVITIFSNNAVGVGPQGIAGATGPTGATGATGPAGLAVSWALGIETDLVVATNVTNAIIIPRNATINKVYAYCKTAPVGANIVLDIRKNNVSIWNTTPSNRLTILDGQNSGTQTMFDTISIIDGDIITIDIISVGSSTTGKDLTVTLKFD